jgi:hypothetical protein
MTEDDVVNLLRSECCNGDTEADHCRADEILIEFLIQLGYHRAATEWLKVDRCYA